MRVLFSSTATEGHVAPLVPLARAFALRGDEVAFATSAAFEARVRAEGISTFPAGLDEAALRARMDEYRPQIAELPLGERRPFLYAMRFARIDSPAKLPELLGVAKDWRPDLIVHDATELCAPPVAAALGIPSVNQSFGQVIPAACHERAAEDASELWRRLGIAPEPWNGMYRGAYVDICPPSVAGESVPHGTTTFARRPATAGGADGEPSWRRARPDAPNVYVTLGTMLDERDLLRLLLDALAKVDCNVLMTTGRRGDPSALEPCPANATIERFVPQSDVLPHCSVVVCHGGSGTTYGALAHGLPLLMLPHAADQFDNAAAAQAAGVAKRLLPSEIDVDAVHAAVVELLTQPAYARRARLVADEIAAMPDSAHVAAALVAHLRQ